MKIHGISTGTITINNDGREVRGAETLRRLNEIMHRGDADEFPIWAWLIEHHEGPILIDTGQAYSPPQSKQVDRQSGGGFEYRMKLKFDTSPEDEIGPQLRRLGFAPTDIRRVVLTHLHPDHAGGIHHFHDAEFFVSRTECDSALQRAEKGTPLPWPDWFNPHLIDFEPHPFGPFAQSHAITAAADLLAIPTPGHTRGHISVILRPTRGTEPLILFTGDAAFSQQTLLAGVIAGISEDPRQVRETHEKLRSFVLETPTIVLTAHDPHAAERLSRSEIARVPLPGDDSTRPG